MITVSVEDENRTTVYKLKDESIEEFLAWLELHAEKESSNLFDDLIIDIELEDKRKNLKMEVDKENYEDRSETRRPEPVGRRGRKSSEPGLQERKKKERQ